MKQKIFKYTLNLEDYQEVELPFNSKILTVQMQGDNICIWAIVTECEKKEVRRFEMFGTGFKLPELFLSTRNYIGTIQLSGLVFHLFEIIN